MRWLSRFALATVLLSSVTYAQLDDTRAAAAQPEAAQPGAAEQAVEDALGAPRKQTKAATTSTTASTAALTSTTSVPEKDIEYTTFNGMKIPPIVDLSGTTFDEDIAYGYWIVDAFSPYCHHCKALAPKYHTIHEFYYSLPPPTLEDGIKADTFLGSYNLTFGKLDCVAFGTKCNQLSVRSFPTLKLLKDGKELKSSTGDRSMELLSLFIEECLEIIRPGSRPKEGIKSGLKDLPKVGAHEFKSVAPAITIGDRDDTNLQSSAEETGAEGLAIAGPGRLAPKNPTQMKYIPNPDGTSVPFTARMFDTQVKLTLHPYFIKFCIPSSKHCQRMAPAWNEMARDVKGKLDVIELNCEVEKLICRGHNVKQYPTIILKRGPENFPYEGLRGVGDLSAYAQNVVLASEPIRDINATEFARVEETEPVIFLYFYDHATTSEDFLALQRLPMYMNGRAKLFRTNDSTLVKQFKITTWPKLLVSRSGKPSYYDWLMPQEIRNVGKVLNWMQSVWLPLVPQLNAANAREILNGHFAVLGILNRDRPEEMTIARRELLNAAIDWEDRRTKEIELERLELRDAKQLRIEEAEDRNDQRGLRDAKGIRIDMHDIHRKEVRFAYVDGIFWERWIRTSFGITVRDGERVIINDEDNRQYWDHTITGNPIVPSRTSILETLPKVVANPPRLNPKPNGSSARLYLFRMRRLIMNHPIVAISGPILIIVALIIQWLRRRSSFSSNSNAGWSGKRGYGNTGSFFHLSDGNHSARLLGGGLPNGKAD